MKVKATVHPGCPWLPLFLLLIVLAAPAGLLTTGLILNETQSSELTQQYPGFALLGLSRYQAAQQL